MSKYIVDIHGEIEGDYEIIGKYQEPTVKAIPIEKLEQIREDIADLMRYYDYEPKIQKCLDIVDKAIKEVEQ